MNLQAYTISLAQAQQLKELGVKQNSLYYFIKWDICEDDDWNIGTNETIELMKENPMVYPCWVAAFTMTELIYMICYVPEDLFIPVEQYTTFLGNFLIGKIGSGEVDVFEVNERLEKLK